MIGHLAYDRSPGGTGWLFVLLLLLLLLFASLIIIIMVIFWRPIPTLAGRSELRVRAGDCVNVKFQTGKGTPINLEQ